MALPFFQDTPSPTSQTPRECPSCHGVDFWESPQGRLFCLTCTKPPRADFVKRRLRRLPDGTLADLTEIEFRARYPAETWDWWEHMTEEDVAHARPSLWESQGQVVGGKLVPSRVPRGWCVWCGRYNGKHDPRCIPLQDHLSPVMTFGKYKGKKIIAIFRMDPGYCRWIANLTVNEKVNRRLIRDDDDAAELDESRSARHEIVAEAQRLLATLENP